MGQRRRHLALAALLLACALGTARAEPSEDEASFETVRVLAQQGKWAEADVVLAKVAGRARTRGDPEAELLALNSRLTCLRQLHDLRRLRDVSRRIRALYREAGDPASVAQTDLDLGYLETELANLEVAEQLLIEAATFFTEAKEPMLGAHAALRLADVHARRRRYAAALDRAEEAEAVFREEGDDVGVAGALNVQGAIHLDLGDAVRARKLLEEAEALYGEDLPDARADVAANIGLAHATQGRIPDALRALEEAREDFLGLGDLRSASRVGIQIASILARHGDEEKALARLETAQSELTDDPVGLGYLRRYRGDLLLRLGRAKEAKAHFAAALETASTIADRGLASACHRGLAEVYLAAKKQKRAIDHAGRALSGVGELVAGLAPVAGALGRGEREAVFETAVRVGFASGVPRAAFDLLERSRAGSLVEKLGGRGGVGVGRLAPKLERAETDARETVLAAQSRLARARAGATREEVRAAVAAYDAALVAYEAVVDRIQRSRTVEAGGALAAPSTLAEVEEALGPREVLVLYALTGVRAWALVVTREDARIVRLADRETIARALAEVDVPGQDADTVGTRIGALGALLVAELRLPTGTDRVLVSPDGGLAYLPWALLWPKTPVALVPSATVLAALRARPAVPGKRVVAVGDPLYVVGRAGRAYAVFAPGGRLSPLPGSGQEVEAVTGEDDVPLLGKQATEEELFETLATRPRWRAVHFACHGLLNDERPSLSALALTPSEHSDGFLTVLEVYGHRIAADLVVLSACETGLGRPVAGDGILGLTQAFLYAGAGRVVASLWKVDDEATRDLMTAFYDRWRAVEEREGAAAPSAAATLRAAQEEVRKKHPHPRDWAGWVLWGLPE